MTTNSYFSSKGSFEERQLVNDLIQEMIQFAGDDIYYIPRTSTKFDNILGEDNRSTFDMAIPIEAYLDDHSAPRGQSEILGKFGFEVRDSYTVSISPRRFKQEVVSRNIDGILSMPRAGDLLFLDLKVDDSENNWTLLEIQFIQNEEPHYQFGQTSVWKVNCEMFRYNNEKFNTGLSLLDNYGYYMGINSAEYRITTVLNSSTLVTMNNKYLLLSANHHNQTQNIVIESNDTIQEEALNIVEDFNSANPFGKF